MRVRDVMTSPVHTIGPDAPAWEALGLMRAHRIRRLPVVEDGRLVGIVTWTDLVRIRPPALGGRWHVPNVAAGAQVCHLMSTAVVSVDPEIPVQDAAALMQRHKFGGLPVLEHGRLVGIVTESDLFDVFVEVFAVGPHETRLCAPVGSIARDLPVIVAAMAEAGIPILALHTLRLERSQAVEIVVSARDAVRARGQLEALGLAAAAEEVREAVYEG
ncbi:MAG: CBS domain-containing protein [Armatimonadota bacterium]|nr:CBS domain-containing protein [Armatimonadota bacterium]MDR7486479.1 CBS domain-containing protein [Armatimonadota bacterium]MDR7532245.1 CBS domain-containing protein [Armatimonadota bacterium]MDR7537180.1 CBS domain-containing protein [Armatimonadota bacterium]